MVVAWKGHLYGEFYYESLTTPDVRLGFGIRSEPHNLIYLHKICKDSFFRSFLFRSKIVSEDISLGEVQWGMLRVDSDNKSSYTRKME